MWIGLTDAEQEFWSNVATFAQRTVLPHVRAWDKKGAFPRSLWRTLGRKHLLGIPFSGTSENGDAQELRRLAIALDAFAYGSKDLGIVNAWGVHAAMAGVTINRWGDEMLRRRVLPGMANGSLIASFALTEPQAGSNVSAMRTTVREEADGFVLDGCKSFVTNGPYAGIFVVIAREDTSSQGGWSAFVVDRDARGLVVNEAQDKSCIRTSECCDIELRKCRVGRGHLLGVRGGAMESIVLPVLDNDRCVIWAGRVGRLRSMVEDAASYALTRTQFGQPIARHQAVLFKLAEMKAHLEVSETAMSAALTRLVEGSPVRQSAAVARYVVGAATRECADRAMQTFGGYGFYPMNHVERYHRDARLDGIGGGTDEIQRLIIGKELLSSIDIDRAWMSRAVVPEVTVRECSASSASPNVLDKPVHCRQLSRHSVSKRGVSVMKGRMTSRVRKGKT